MMFDDLFGRYDKTTIFNHTKHSLDYVFNAYDTNTTTKDLHENATWLNLV